LSNAAASQELIEFGQSGLRRAGALYQNVLLSVKAARINEQCHARAVFDIILAEIFESGSVHPLG
jgi:hypothetical protein